MHLVQTGRHMDALPKCARDVSFGFTNLERRELLLVILQFQLVEHALDQVAEAVDKTPSAAAEVVSMHHGPSEVKPRNIGAFKIVRHKWVLANFICRWLDVVGKNGILEASSQSTDHMTVAFAVVVVDILLVWEVEGRKEGEEGWGRKEGRKEGEEGWGRKIGIGR